MDRDSFDLAVRTFKKRLPFRPFTVALTNGDRLEVDHPDALMMREGVAIFWGPAGVPSLFDFEGVTRVIGDLAGQSATAD